MWALRSAWGYGCELGRVLWVLPWIEWGRRYEGPASLLVSVRARGKRCRRRGTKNRQRLRRVISWVDRGVPPVDQCLRRVLLEISLDAGAAEEPLHLGLDARGGARSGHAWLGEEANADYDAVFTV